MANPLLAFRTPGITEDGDIEELIDRASRANNVPAPMIRAIIKQESAGNPNAQSSVGARGLMQLMPETAKDLGVTDPTNPEQNVMGGTKYFRKMLDRFGNDPEKALAAYNAGPGNVEKYNGIPPFKETQNYVSRIMNNLKSSSPKLELPTGNAAPVDIQNKQLAQPIVSPEILQAFGLDDATQKRERFGNKLNKIITGASGIAAGYNSPDYATQIFERGNEREKQYEESNAKKLAGLSELIKANKTKTDLPNSAQEYQYYLRDSQSRGEPVKSYDQWQIAKAQAGAQAPIAFERLNSDIKFKKKSQALQEASLNKEDEAKKHRLKEIKAREQDKAIERLSSKLGNSQDAVNTIGEIEKVLGFQLEDYDAEKGTVKGKEKDLPGISVPGLGRVSFYSGDAKKLENTMSKLFNLEIKDRSGAAVTSNELERLRDEYSNGMFNTEAEKIGGLQRYKNALYNLMVNQEAGFTPEAVAEYKNRSGVTSERLKPRSSAQPKAASQQPQQQPQSSNNFDENKLKNFEHLSEDELKAMLKK